MRQYSSVNSLLTSAMARSVDQLPDIAQQGRKYRHRWRGAFFRAHAGAALLSLVMIGASILLTRGQWFAVSWDSLGLCVLQRCGDHLVEFGLHTPRPAIRGELQLIVDRTFDEIRTLESCSGDVTDRTREK